MKNERFFFDALLNNYTSLTKEIGLKDVEQVRHWDVGTVKPRSSKSRHKIFNLLLKKRAELDKQITDLAELWGMNQ